MMVKGAVKYLIFLVIGELMLTTASAQDWRHMLRYFEAKGNVKSIYDETKGNFGKQDFIQKKCKRSFTTSGMLTEEITYDLTGNALTKNKLNYSVTGKLIREEKWVGDLLYQATIHQYDDNDSLSSITDSLMDGTAVIRILITYDDEQDRREKKVFGPDGREEYSEITLFDTQNRPIEMQRKEQDKKAIWIWGYNTSGKCGYRMYSNMKYENDSTVYFYKNDTLLIEEITYDFADKKIKSSIKYEYNEQGKRSIKTEFSGENKLRYKTTYSYSPEGRLTHEDKYGEFVTYFEYFYSYEFDKKGNKIKSWYLPNIGEGFQYLFSSFDTEGNWQTKTEIKKDKVYEVTKRVIEYY